MVFVALHPGTVDTALSLPFHRGVSKGKLFSPGQAAAQLLATIDRLGPADSGGFFAYDGQPIPWSSIAAPAMRPAAATPLLFVTTRRPPRHPSPHSAIGKLPAHEQLFEKERTVDFASRFRSTRLACNL